MSASKGRAQPQKSSERRVLFYSLLLALQYGAQPLISKRFIRSTIPKFPLIIHSLPSLVSKP
ncbi:unnamed protein product [Rhodiola kirilowii]